ncbi:MAG: O-antigen ligase family protein [Flavobacteriales bacterium]|nr:O-antigen ligase family protein [Flavobacteriales bacterium]
MSKNKNNYKFTLLDIGMGLLLLSESISALNSVASYNSIDSITRVVIISIFYLFYKTAFKPENNRKVFYFLFILNTTILLVFTFIYFQMFVSDLKENGFHDLNNFKHLYLPLGSPNNIWSTIVLLLLPFNLIWFSYQKTKASKIISAIVLTLNIFCLIISFSRGIYLSSILFLISFNLLSFKLINLKKRLLFNGIIILIVSICVYPVKNSVLTTLSIQKTTSQNRSTEGRLSRWQHAIDIVKEKPILGWGQENYIRALDRAPYNAEDAVFSSRTNNTYLQLLIEKGIFGLLAFFSILLIAAYVIFRSIRNSHLSNKEKTHIVVIGACLTAYLFRELTFSTLFDDSSAYLVFFILISLFTPYDKTLKEVFIPTTLKKSLVPVTLIGIFYVSYINVNQFFTNRYNEKFITALSTNDTLNAKKNLDKALQLFPENTALRKHKALLLSQNNLVLSLSHTQANFVQLQHTNKTSLNTAVRILEQLAAENPYDDEVQHNLGWLNWSLGKTDVAGDYFDTATKQNPYNHVYLISRVLHKISTKNYADNLVIDDLSKAIRYSPDILESLLIKELSLFKPIIVNLAINKSIKELEAIVKETNNPILKARLACILMKSQPSKALELLNDVTMALPNLSRPWVYKAELVTSPKEKEAFYNKALFLNGGDYYAHLSYANFCTKNKRAKEGVLHYKKALDLFKNIATPSNRKNNERSYYSTVNNSYIPEELIYYATPDIKATTLFDYFSNYYIENENEDGKSFYRNLSLQYKQKIFIGENKLY